MRVLLYDAHWPPPDGIAESIPGRVAEVEFVRDRALYDCADAVVFHLPEWKRDRIAARRPWSWQLQPVKRPGQVWVGASYECEDHYPIMTDVRFMEHFDITMTYRLHADIPTTYVQAFGPVAAMVEAFRKPPAPKTERALIATFISSTFDRNERRAYLFELSQHMAVDSYGRFMNNRPLDQDAGRQTKLAIISRYKFTAAFENARSRDYVTEKLFDPLWVGSVPVYYGAPNVADFAPADGCYIDASKFPDPRDLAAYLKWLDETPAEYDRFFAWKNWPLKSRFLALANQEQIAPLERLAALLLARREDGNRAPGR